VNELIPSEKLAGASEASPGGGASGLGCSISRGKGEKPAQVPVPSEF
jgi:hypothetical protein